MYLLRSTIKRNVINDESINFGKSATVNSVIVYIELCMYVLKLVYNQQFLIKG